MNLQKHDTLFLLGDYIDRGPKSKQVVDTIIQLQEQGFDIQCLLGNHEWLLLNAAYDKTYTDVWLLRNGGASTLDSYGILEADYLQHIPEKHLHFYKHLQYIIELEDYILVHAGINFKDADPFSDYHSMIWIRDWHKSANKRLLDGKKIVHGHTPRSVESLQNELAQEGTFLFDIDCGCVYKHKNFGGKLVALNLDTLELTVQENREHY
ncbi:MAG: metallophosphoesterase [Chitinophagales bacterium]